MKKRWWVAGAVLGVAAGLVVKTLNDAGQFKQLTPHASGACKPVPGMPGAEDLTFHPTLGFAYVSSDDRRATAAGRPVPGGIFRYEPGSNTPPVLLTRGFSQDFHPHGISLFVAPDGTQTLFVVNHPDGATNQVERFEVGADGMLVHKATLKDPLLLSPNDILAVDAERFYVTNDHGHPPGAMRTLEDYLQLGLGSVVYFDGQRFQTVIEGTKYANGINVSRDGKTVYLTQTVGKLLQSYARDPATGALTLSHAKVLDTAPDNIELDAQGDLWIAAHPKLFDFVSHATDPKGLARAPAQVLRFSGTGADMKVTEVYLDDGKQTAATATAAVFGKRMLLGPVFDADILDCELP
ncbi:SMP-30/gluconolactonase/LRE family protein [Myxococcus stipitatus]|uniref:strictosidine synthase family protein n=1 Tax=Myxococcus stipitatus TaxID=83455 RepID=UPI00314537FE